MRPPSRRAHPPTRQHPRSPNTESNSSASIFPHCCCLSACETTAYAGAIASTRNGLPLPSTILSGAAITTAPVGGN
jgi:hypothetical protein